MTTKFTCKNCNKQYEHPYNEVAYCPDCQAILDYIKYDKDYVHNVIKMANYYPGWVNYMGPLVSIEVDMEVTSDEELRKTDFIAARININGRKYPLSGCDYTYSNREENIKFIKAWKKEAESLHVPFHDFVRMEDEEEMSSVAKDLDAVLDYLDETESANYDEATGKIKRTHIYNHVAPLRQLAKRLKDNSCLLNGIGSGDIVDALKESIAYLDTSLMSDMYNGNEVLWQRDRAVKVKHDLKRLVKYIEEQENGL